MQSLGHVLERFNRKERNLLIRDILGDADANRLCLHESFRKRVADALGIAPIPANAWWGTDYHISWLAGALSVFLKREPEIYCNKRHLEGSHGRQLVEGNQEDVDLIIATDQHLILIEVKAYSGFTSKQFKSKVDRLNILYKYFETLSGVADKSIRFHFLLMSPNEPKKLKAPVPEWAPRLNWIKLALPQQRAVLSVERCDKNGHTDKDGCHWQVVDLKGG